jgi:hypothetical protein
MTEYGLIIGIALLIIVILCAWALAAKANSGVRHFREEQHENFQGRKSK